MAPEIVPLRDLPISTVVDGVELRGEIHSLYPNDMTVIITAPVRGLGSATHVPSFAMGALALATCEGGTTKTLTPYGQETADSLLKRCYEYSQGNRPGWPVYAVGPSGWVRLSQE
jgi:hypothetical protein